MVSEHSHQILYRGTSRHILRPLTAPKAQEKKDKVAPVPKTYCDLPVNKSDQVLEGLMIYVTCRRCKFEYNDQVGGRS